MKQVLAPVREKTELLPGTYHIVAHAPDIAPVARPGQFVMINCGDDTILRRPISIHRVPDKENVSLLFRTIGTGTHNIARIKKGDTINLLGPLGNGFEISDDAEKLLLIAGGMGIAPLVFLAEKANELGKQIRLHNYILKNSCPKESNCLLPPRTAAKGKRD
jgi:dihydroorotate dehydrogenase electron transfer subunit